MKTFDDEGMLRPNYKVLIGEKEIIVELSMPDTDAPIGPKNG